MPEALRLRPDPGLRLQSLDRVREYSELRLSACDVDAPTAYAAAAVAEELCANVLEHGDARNLELEVAVRAGRTYVSLRDDGAAFDPSEGYRQIQEGFVLAEMTNRHLGLYIVHQLCSRCLYERGGDGWNRLEVEIRPGELFAPPPPR